METNLKITLGTVDLSWLNFARSRRALITTQGVPPRGLSKYLATISKYLATKSKARIAEPFGQRLSSLSTELTLIYVEQLQHNRVALYKTTTKCCKNHLQ
ncbi:MAG: hypothetical protein LPH21_14215, partial [Shewanella sp.]|nr:hypothetical protein [Shewanella sp.]